jgi:hypothetical protein
VDPQPQLSAADLRALLGERFDHLCNDVAAAVNAAQPGHVINQSEEKVRDLLADFRQELFQAALQLRLDAAQAASPPCTPPGDQQAPAEQGP